MKRILAVMMAVAIGATTATTAKAVWNPDPMAGGNVVCDAPGYRMVIKTIPDGAGGVIVMWMDPTVSPKTPWLYVQRMSATGVPRWTTNGVFLGQVGGLPHADIASDGALGAIVAWGRGNSVLINRVDASGALVWGSGRYVASTGAPGSKPRLVSSGTGGAYVAWAHTPVAGGGQELRLMRYDALGQRTGLDFTRFTAGVVLSSATPLIRRHALTLYPAGAGVGVAWEEGSSTFVDRQRVARVSSDGISQWGRTANATPIRADLDPSSDVTTPWTLAPSIEGGGPDLLVNFDTRVDFALYRQALLRYRSDGSLAHSLTRESRSRSQAVGDGAGHFVLEQVDPWGTPGEIDYLSFFDGSVVTTPDPVFTIDRRLLNQITSDGGGGAFVPHASNDSNILRVYQVGPGGARRWGATGVVVSRYPRLNVTNVFLTRASAGGGIPVQERRTIVGGVIRDAIVAQRITSDGRVGDVVAPQPFGFSARPVQIEGSAGAGTPHAFAFAAPTPNPASGPTALRFTLAEAGVASLVVYDAGGRAVRSVASGAYAAGVYTATWDLRDEAGHRVAPGMYFARVAAGAQQATRKILVAE